MHSSIHKQSEFPEKKLSWGNLNLCGWSWLSEWLPGGHPPFLRVVMTAVARGGDQVPNVRRRQPRPHSLALSPPLIRGSMDCGKCSWRHTKKQEKSGNLKKSLSAKSEVSDRRLLTNGGLMSSVFFPIPVFYIYFIYLFLCLYIYFLANP